MRAIVRQQAEPGTTFAVGAFAGTVGKEVPFKALDLTTTVTIVAATVVEDGRAVDLEFEMSDKSVLTEAIRRMLLSATFDGMSFRLTGLGPVEPAE